MHACARITRTQRTQAGAAATVGRGAKIRVEGARRLIRRHAAPAVLHGDGQLVALRVIVASAATAASIVAFAVRRLRCAFVQDASHLDRRSVRKLNGICARSDGMRCVSTIHVACAAA
jgi:hypothetical protein